MSLSPVGIETETRARLLQGRIGLAQAKLEVGRRQAGDHVALVHGRSEIDAQLFDAAGDLEAEGDLFFGGKRAADGDAARERLELQADDLDRLAAPAQRRCATPPTRRRRMPRRRPTRAKCKDQDNQPDAQCDMFP